MKELTTVIALYTSRGLHICDVHGDNEFACVRENIRPIAMNIAPADSHVGDIERSIRTIKERLRSCVHGLPFKRLPKLLLIHMVTDCTRCLNQFPRKHGISSTLSPTTIVTGAAGPDYAAMRLEFGTYAQIFEDSEPTNTPRARSLGAIALNPTGNAQGDYYFLSLASGSRVSRHNWTALPITETAIARVEALALHDGQPLIQARGLVVEWRPDQPIDDSEYDVDYVDPRAPAPADVFDLADYDPVDPTELDDLYLDATVPLFAPAVPPALPVPRASERDNDDDNYDHDTEDDDNYYGDDNDDDINDTSDVYNDGDLEDTPTVNQGAEDHDMPPEDQGARQTQGGGDNDQGHTPRYDFRARAPTARHTFRSAIDNPHNSKSYYPPTQLLQNVSSINMEAEKHFVFNYIFTQMSANAGIRKHGKAAETALMKEFTQLENLSVYQMIDPRTLTREQRNAALRAHNLVKEKRNGTLKGRTVADGRKQRNLYDKSETASPTVSTDALLLTVIVDAHESRDVGTADIAGAYLKADMDDFVVIKFTGQSVRILYEMNPEHKKFIVIENGSETLYGRLDKALYGCVKSALLWYKLFTENLRGMGFVLNHIRPMRCKLHDRR